MKQKTSVASGGSYGHLSQCYLHSQSERVSQDQHKHNILKLAGVDDSPEFQLRWVLWDVDLDRLSLQCIIHTLTLTLGTQKTVYTFSKQH